MLVVGKKTVGLVASDRKEFAAASELLDAASGVLFMVALAACAYLGGLWILNAVMEAATLYGKLPPAAQ